MLSPSPLKKKGEIRRESLESHPLPYMLKHQGFSPFFFKGGVGSINEVERGGGFCFTLTTKKAPSMTQTSSPIQVILVDDHDHPVGLCEKLEAHETGALHRAISVFLTSTGTLDQTPENLVLLQQRSLAKYHSPKLWSNAACTHPLEGESPEQAARRALKVELGIEVDTLNYQGYFIYKTPVSTSGAEDLIEHELDHIFVGKYSPSQSIPFNPDEVAQAKWQPFPHVVVDLESRPDAFTHWLPYLMKFLSTNEKIVDYRA